MSTNAKQRAEEFLGISAQFQLGALTTESSHPVTANLSEVARQNIAEALKLLFDVDLDPHSTTILTMRLQKSPSPGASRHVLRR